MRQPPIELHRGELRVAGTALHLDAQRRAELRLRLPRPRRPHRPPRPDHRHPGHAGAHEPPARGAEAGPQGGAAAGRPTAQPFGLGALTLELFPAGHVLGSAQLRVTLEDGRTLGYSGDLCTDTPCAAEPAEVMPCDVLVLESTFGLPRYVFPPKEETLAAIRRFCDDALSDGVTPVLYGYALGKAQEILAFLAGAGYACRCHPIVHAINRIYEAHGVALPGVRPLDAEAVAAGEVVVVPQQLAWSPAMKSVRRRRTAVLTGWAIDGDRMFQGVDAAFPLSDHCDYPSLLRLRPGHRRRPGLHRPRPRRPAGGGPAPGGDPGRAAAGGEPARASVVQGARDRAHRQRRRRGAAPRQVRPQGPEGRPAQPRLQDVPHPQGEGERGARAARAAAGGGRQDRDLGRRAEAAGRAGPGRGARRAGGAGRGWRCSSRTTTCWW